MIKKEKTIMLQQVMTNPGEIIFREVPVPEVKENQVLVKIMESLHPLLCLLPEPFPADPLCNCPG